MNTRYTRRPSAARSSALNRLALLSMAVAVAACGGGGGGAGPLVAAPAPAPAPAPSPAPAPPADHFLVAGSASSDTGGHRVVVADSTRPGSAAVLSVPVLTSVPVVSTASYTVDLASASVAYRGAPMTFFVDAGMLWQIDLSASRVPVSLRISSMTSGCQIQMVAPLDASGVDAWVLVMTAGADGDCATSADNRQVFVRSGASSATAPTMVPPTTRVEPVYLTGADGALWWMLAVDQANAAPRMVAYGQSLNVVEVAGGSGIRVLNARGHAAKAPEGTFVRADDILRRIEATATSISIGGPQHNFIGASSLVLLEGSAMYFGDGDAVYKVAGQTPAALLARPNPGSVATSLLALSPNAVVLTQQAASSGSVVLAVDKRTGSVQPLLRQDAGINEVWALRGERLFYFAGSRGNVGELRSIGVDGSGDIRAISNLLLIGRILSRVGDRGELTEVGSTKSLLACQPLAGRGDCRGSSLLQIDLSNLDNPTVLGSFPGSAATSWQARGGAAFEAIKGALVEVSSISAVGSPVRKELYVFNPGEANSLKLIN